MIIAGGDEAGRGAVMGPLVVSLVSIRKGRELKLSRVGIRDSKLLTRRKRRFLFDEIYSLAEEVKLYKISIDEINEAMRSRVSINELEALNFARLIDELKTRPSKIFIDSPDVVSERFGLRIKLFSKKPLVIDGVKQRRGERVKDSIRIISEHKADARYPVVSTASIIAKVARDEEIERIREREGIRIGSGYPSDRYTIEAIKANLKTDRLTPYIRDYWKTLRAIKQLKMQDFFN